MDDLLAVTSRDNAAELLEVAVLVYEHYVFSNAPARSLAPAEYASIFSDAVPGVCDSASVMVRQLLPKHFEAYNLNLIAPRYAPTTKEVSGQNFGYWGHTVAEVVLERGAAAIDPTYGFLLVTQEPRFTTEVFRTHNFKQFALSQPPFTERQRYDFQHGLVYPRAGLPFSSVARSGDPIEPTFPAIRVPTEGGVAIGRLDGSSAEMLNTFGGWGDHIGYWYEPTKSDWRFAPNEPGRYAVVFYLLGGDNAVQKAALDVEVSVSGGQLATLRYLPSQADPKQISITFDASGETVISFKSNAAASRLIDSIHAKRLSGVEYIGSIFRQITNL
ncbi:hypothetical protein SAMN04488059_1684 [Devosia psychrophila]|nr:hypothetical protein SAMN04488059_1684 [Devosia psychrophila]